MENTKPFTILVLMSTTPKWLSLTRDQRNQFFENDIKPVFEAVSKTVTVRLFDSEYFNAEVTDFMIIEATNLHDYQLLLERLRDTKIYSEPYFEVKEIIVGQENRFKDFDKEFK